MNYEALRKQVVEVHQHNTQKVIELLRHNFDLSRLGTILDPEVTEIYQRLIPDMPSCVKLIKQGHSPR